MEAARLRGGRLDYDRARPAEQRVPVYRIFDRLEPTRRRRLQRAPEYRAWRADRQPALEPGLPDRQHLPALSESSGLRAAAFRPTGGCSTHAGQRAWSVERVFRFLAAEEFQAR